MNRKIIILFLINIFISSIIVISSYHWFSIWIGLEINTVSIICLICYNFSPRSVEATIKYFLVQAFSAAIILNAILVNVWLFASWEISGSLNMFSSLVIVFALSLKLGLFPCHYWFPDVMQGVNLMNGLLLSTWQKVAPFIILISVINHFNAHTIVIISTISVLIGGWGGLNQSQVRKILAFSSISHFGWICCVSVYSVNISIIMLLIYIIISSTVFLILNELKIHSLISFNNLVYYNSWSSLVLTLVMLSLGGLPPLAGFLNKFVGLQCLLENNLIISPIILIIGSLLSLYFYLRVSYNVSLCFFIFHSLSLFSWRNINFLNTNASLNSFINSFLVSLSIFGLFLFPLIISFSNIIFFW
uniref:NADH dehydrogenase subunit 2 n=1 Tax=Xyloplax princealberti TaxID=3083365 RepID=UPI002E76972C|nr:NADH dehydrogenase subunit 2 [Xyloplax princealberti]WQM48564.1 NADH dehydrogenase subunit 2 [Xyloplax princealberti]